MPRYVILEHDWPEQHWDFMLEAGPVLETWKLSAAPAPGISIPAEKSFDHRLMYLDYEGPISGDRGTVIRWDAGSYEMLSETSRARSTQENDRRVIQLRGTRMQGKVEWTCQCEPNWIIRFSGEDGFASAP